MAEGKNNIIVYRDWLPIFEKLTDEEAGKLVKHFFRYVNDLNPKPPDRLIDIAFEPIKQTLKRDLKKWESKSQKNSENARIRWEQNNANACERIKLDANHADRDKDRDRDKDISLNGEFLEILKPISFAYRTKLTDKQAEERMELMKKELLNSQTFIDHVMKSINREPKIARAEVVEFINNAKLGDDRFLSLNEIKEHFRKSMKIKYGNNR